jgi:DNA repair protein RecO (recombination protein O)
MERTLSTHAIVIRRERSGEFHKALTLLTADRGLVSATAYGAYKMNSHLRLGSEPFTWSRAQLYCNPVKRSYKVVDLEILASFEGLQADLAKMAAASLWAEVAARSYGAGELSDGLFRLFLDSLQALDAVEPRREPYVTAQFLWRFLGLAGWQPDTARCDRCGAPLGAAARGAAAPRPALYSASANALLCPACGLPSDTPVPPGLLRYLEGTAAHAVAQASAVTLEPAALAAARDLLPRMVQSVLEGELASLRLMGVGS